MVASSQIIYTPSEGVDPIQEPYRTGQQYTPSESDQWMRKIALVLHDAAPAPSQTPSEAATRNPPPQGQSLRIVAREGEVVELPVVKVAATAPEPSNPHVEKPETSSSSGEGINLTPEGLPQFQVTFSVKRNTNVAPNLLYARIYNLSKNTMDKVQQFKKVELSAGYQRGRYGVIFKGNIAQFKRGKENATDTYLEIFAGDSELAINTTVVSGEHPEGTKQEQIIKEGAKQIGVPEGRIDIGDYGNQQLLRSQSFLTSTMEWMRDISKSANADVYVDMGQFNAISRDRYVPGEAIVLSPATGLVSIPEVTPQGVQVRCLMNPDIVVGGLIKLNLDLLSGVPYLPGTVPAGPVTEADYTTSNKAQQNINFLGPGPHPMPAFTTVAGNYKVIMIEYTGETRGNPWYCDLVCVALNDSGGYIYSADLPYKRTGKEANLIDPKIKAEADKKAADDAAKSAAKPSNPGVLPPDADPSTTGVPE